MHPSEDTHLHWTREYLEKAKQSYVEAGGNYTFSKSEEKVDDIYANIDSVSKVTFSIGGYRNFVVELTGELKDYTILWEDKEPLLLCDHSQESFTKDTFIPHLRICISVSGVGDILLNASDTWYFTIYLDKLFPYVILVFNTSTSIMIDS